MPANLPPQYIEARTRFINSKDIEEKIEILQYMIAIIPKHKGTNKLIGELRSKLAHLRREAQSKPSKRKHYDAYYIARQGAGQVVLLGFPNVGKSKLITRLTNADSRVAPFPFTTDKPVIGMMPYENINIQLIDTPPITDDYIAPQLLELIRRADITLLMVDIGSDSALDQAESIISRLREAKIKLTVKESEFDYDETEELSFDTPMNDQSFAEDFIRKKAIMLANKSDLEGSQDRLAILNELYTDEFPIIAISAENDTNFDLLKRLIYEHLNIIRVYTKPIGKKADLTDPIVLHRGSTVVDAAVEIHRDFAEKLKFAKIWGGENNGQRVSRDHPLEDGNILEFHISE